jgi:outer membrane protein assembly factor BamB
MSENPARTSGRVHPAGPWSQTALSAAVVCGAFAGVFFILLAGDFVRWSMASRAYQGRITTIKLQPGEGEVAVAQAAEIRQIDLKFRRETLRWTAFSRRCGLLLVISAGLALICLKASRSLEGPVPRRTETSHQDFQIVQDRRARWAVTGCLAFLAVAGVAAALHPTVRFVQAAASTPLPSAEQFGKNWYRFRGPQGDAVSPFATVDVDLVRPTGSPILWKTPIPLPGHNSPIVWNDRVFVSGADKERRQVFCLDAATGKILWTGDVPSGAPQDLEVQEETGWAASTLATDGVRVYAIFATGDLAAFELSGRRAWARSLGVPDSAYGYASSLEVFGGRVIVQYDQGQPDQAKSKIMAFDGATGRLAWEKARPVGGSWTSPIVAKVGPGYQLVTAGNPWVIAYDPNTGDDLWRANVTGGDMAPSPICADGKVVVIEPYAKVVALRTDRRGDVTTSGVVWKSDNGGPDIVSPVSDGKYVYLLDTDGTLNVLSLADGSGVYQKALDLGFRASPTLVRDSLVLLSEKGTLLRLATGPAFKELGRSELGEECRASPAFADGRWFIRGKQNLVCIGAGSR